MIYLQDYEIKKLNNEKELNDYVAFRKEDDTWMSVPISKCRIIRKNEDESIEDFMEKNGINASQEAVQSTLDDNGMFLKVTGRKNAGVYPVRYTAVSGILNRAGLSCFTMSNSVETKKVRVLTPEEKMKFINKCLGLYDEEATILIRDEKVSSMASDRYAILPVDELKAAIESVLDEKYPMAEFVSGEVSHESITLSWNLDDEDMEEDLNSRLEEAGFPPASVKSGISFLTSDVTKANASVLPYFIIDGKKICCGKPIELKHIGKKTAKDFEKMLPKLNAMFENNVTRLEELSNITLRYPADCLRAVAYINKLPKKLTLKVAQKWEETVWAGPATAFDVYFALQDIVETYQKNEKTSITGFLNIQGTVAEMLYEDYEKYDYPFEWKKGE